jgi:mRNA interferase RelE/StbE
MAKPNYALSWTELSKKDYDGLDGSERVVVDKGLARISVFGMQAGAPLLPPLSSCRKIKHRKMGIRIIFRESDKGIQIIEIVAIGKRKDFEVYTDAKQRLKPK